MTKITVALATYNEEKNIGKCLESIKDIADEIVIIDGSSTDTTVAIAEQYGARVKVTDNPQIFHINKQKALDMATHEWILQLDADERVTPELAKEIKQVIHINQDKMDQYQERLAKRKLFLRHQKLVEERDGKIGESTGEYVAFFIPRLNYFLGRYLKYGGVYPDGVIRLIKKGKGHFPCKDVHEQIAIDGKVGWLEHDLLHMADPTFSRYLLRNKRYVTILAEQMRGKRVKKDIPTAFRYLVFKPLMWFFLTQVRHKGFLDGYQGVIFSFFSALRFPKAYLQYLKNAKEK